MLSEDGNAGGKFINGFHTLLGSQCSANNDDVIGQKW